MTICLLFIFGIISSLVKGELINDSKNDLETRRVDMIVDIITLNLKKNGWTTILCFGTFPDAFYKKMQNGSYPIAITNIDHEDKNLNAVPYYANTILINLVDTIQYEDTIIKVTSSPYWHPHANVVLYFHQKNNQFLPKLFFSMWYYKAINAIIVQYDDAKEVLLISHYSPYMTEDYKLDHLYGCWTTRKIHMPVSSFEEGLICEDTCRNVSSNSKPRANHLGTCIGFSIISVPYDAPQTMATLNLFQDKTKNFHGFAFRTFGAEVKPFLRIDDNGNGSYVLRARDGLIWSTMAKLMNFSIDLSPSVNVIKKPFNYEIIANQIFDFANRKTDLMLIPTYLFDMIFVEIDHSFPFTDSGVCILSHRAGFDTTLFDAQSIYANRILIVQFLVCFLCIWLTFAFYQGVGKKCIILDQIGKDFMNAIRIILLISLLNPPRQRSFYIFLTISLWSFFVLSFSTQAMIISFLTAVKRGKEVETFEDIIDKGYLIHGVASPDLMQSDSDGKFSIITSRIVPEQDLFECIRKITHDSHRFCLIDCAVGRYLVRNRLNEEGEQYLHMLQDRMHSHYLTTMLTKHSPMTERFNKFLMTFYEAGLIRKWEQYRFNDIKEEPPTRPLGMDDYQSLFNAYCFSVGFIFTVFLLELLTYHVKRALSVKHRI